MYPLIAVAFVAVLHPVGLLVILGLLALGTTVLTYSGTTASPMDQALGTFGPYVDQELCGTQIVSTAGPTAITITHGKVIITYAGVAAMTLATPTAGSPAAGGNDAQALKFIDQSGHAHYLTLSSNVINGNKHIATSGGNVGDEITLTSYGTQYLGNPAGTNWTLS